MVDNFLYVSGDRVASLALHAVQSDNNTRLGVIFEGAADIDPTAAFRIDWERSNGSKAFLGTYLVDDSVEVIIPDVIFSHAGEIQCQVVVLIDGGELWHSTIARARLPRAIEAEVAATPDERRYVEVPASFIEGNLTTYNPDSGRLIDTGRSVDDIVGSIGEMRTISSSSEPGKAGEVCYDADYIYICVAEDTWKRLSLSW